MKTTFKYRNKAFMLSELSLLLIVFPCVRKTKIFVFAVLNAILFDMNHSAIF